MVINKITAKSLSDSYLYQKIADYQKKIIQFVVEAERIDTNSPEFSDLLYDIKRRAVNNSLIKVILSKNIIMAVSPNALTKAFKIFTAKDLKYKSDGLKVFIDASAIVSFNNGAWTCPMNKVDVLISYLVSAACQRIYYAAPEKFVRNTTIVSDGSLIFAKLVNYVVDYLYKINTMPSQKEKLEYLSSCYYQTCILNCEYTNRVREIAIHQAKISEKEADLIDIQVPSEAYMDINQFVQAIAKVLRIDKLTLDVFIDKWVFLYGSGTHFALEMFYAFSTMITDAGVGAYLNNQKTIEKIIGNFLPSFYAKILEIEVSVLNG